MMGPAPFHFKHFSIAQAKNTHKVGTDGVLLGAWIRLKEEDTFLLDVGTGTGLIALMMAQRTGPATRIDAVEIEPGAAAEARENVTISPWPEKIAVHNVAVQQFFSENKYDVVISNPPYFANSLRPPGKKRSQARHTHELSFGDLLQAARRLLAPAGRLVVILPYAEGIHFLSLASKNNLFPRRTTFFRSRAHKPVERLLLELTRSEKTVEESEIILYSDGKNWSEEYKRLTSEFYLRS